MDDHMKKELKKAAKHVAKDQKIASLQAENERLLGILQFSRWTHDTHRPSYALNCLYEGEITIAKFCEWMKAFVAGIDEPLPEVKYRSCGSEFTPKELEAENERLRAALLVAEHGFTISHGLMAYDDGTVLGAKQHFRLDNTGELSAIASALKGGRK